MEIMRSIS